jgi:hypothetical protein
MNKAIAKTWVEALRSDRYMQGRGALRTLTDNGPKDCCLGVLCDLAISNGVEITTKSTVDIDGKLVLFDDKAYMPPASVNNWSGLDEDFAEVLANMNDSVFTFEQIADAIEKKYLDE